MQTQTSVDISGSALFPSYEMYNQTVHVPGDSCTYNLCRWVRNDITLPHARIEPALWQNIPRRI
jgi:hypothetical protein